MKAKIRTRRTPDGLNPYRATMKGVATYGWGQTPTEARERLAANLQREARARARRRKPND
jgi:hypothetical protein